MSKVHKVQSDLLSDSNAHVTCFCKVSRYSIRLHVHIKGRSALTSISSAPYVITNVIPGLPHRLVISITAAKVRAGLQMRAQQGAKLVL